MWIGRICGRSTQALCHCADISATVSWNGSPVEKQLPHGHCDRKPRLGASSQRCVSEQPVCDRELTGQTAAVMSCQHPLLLPPWIGK